MKSDYKLVFGPGVNASNECFSKWCKGCYIPGIGPRIINETVPHER